MRFRCEWLVGTWLCPNAGIITWKIREHPFRVCEKHDEAIQLMAAKDGYVRIGDVGSAPF